MTFEYFFDPNTGHLEILPGSTIVPRILLAEKGAIKSVNIPESVVTIQSKAFFGNELTEVNIPNGVTSIGNRAFAQNSLEEIALPNSLTSIDDYVFEGNNLMEVYLPGSVTHIGYGAFANNSLTGIFLPDSVVQIKEDAFSENFLYKIEIPSLVNYLGRGAFGNNDLTTVVLPNELENSEDFTPSAFDNDVNIYFEGRIFLDQYPTFPFRYKFNRDTGRLTIEDGVVEIPQVGFYRFSSYAIDVEIPDSVKVIGDDAFADIEFSSKVTIPDSVLEIGQRAFSGGRIGVKDQIEIGKSITSIGNEVFRYRNLTEIRIPDSVVSIGAGAFANTQLSALIVGDSVTSIGNEAFYSSRLSKVDLGDSVEFIGDNAFENNSISDFELGQSIISIGKSAFKGNSLSELNIPDSLVTIEKDAFKGNNLTTVNFGSTVSSIGDGAFKMNEIVEARLPAHFVENPPWRAFDAGVRLVFGNSLPVNRLYNPLSGRHLFSANQYEINLLTQTDWQNEGVIYDAPEEGTADVFRFYIPSEGRHFYTALEFERDLIINNQDIFSGWQYEGTAFSAYSTSDYPDDAAAVVRYLNIETGSHVYSTSSYEQGLLDENASFRYEGIAWFGDPMVATESLL